MRAPTEFKFATKEAALIGMSDKRPGVGTHFIVYQLRDEKGRFIKGWGAKFLPPVKPPKSHK